MTSCNFKAPNGATSLLYKNLETIYGADKAAQVWNYTKSEQFKAEYEPTLDENGEPTTAWVTNNITKLIKPKEVDYQFTAVSAILKNLDKVKRWEKQVVNPPILWTKIQKDLNIPKDQVDLIEAQEGDSVEERLTNFLANQSFAVEIETAASKISTQGSRPGDPNFQLGDYFYSQIRRYDDSIKYVKYVDRNNMYDKGSIISEEEYKDAEKEFKKVYENTIRIEPTQHYANLTVPGGTNYTENEISTPAITPSITGHAAFATSKGIGWFRSDEYGTNIGKKANGRIHIYYKGQLQTTLVNSKTNDESEADTFIKRHAERWGNEIEDYYKSSVVDDNLMPTKTRRILEVQSDLFQKGRDKADLVTKNKLSEENLYGLSGSTDTEEYMKGYETSLRYYSPEENYTEQDIQRLLKEKREELESKFKPVVSKENQFLQLLNKDNNWVTFFVKSIIQDSANKGYEKVLFPTGDTASIVEGHTTLEGFKEQQEDRIRILEADKPRFEEEDGKFYVRFRNSVDQDVWRDEYNTREEAQSTIEENIKNIDTEINQLKQELERVEIEGFGALKPIYKFYQETVQNILKKKGYNPTRITDEYGNDWFEVEIKEKDLGMVMLASKAELKRDLSMFGTGTKLTKLEYNEALRIVQDLYNIAATNTKKEYDLTAFKAEAIKKVTTTGYTPLELANIFASFPIPSNVKFNDEFAGLIANSASYQLRSLLFNEVPFLSYDENMLVNATEDLFVPIRDAAGAKTGRNFTSEQQIAGVDTIVAEVWNFYKRDNSLSIGSLLSRGGTIYTKLEAFRDKFRYARNLPNHLSVEKAAVQADNIQLILNSWDGFISRVLYKLESYGLRIKNQNLREQFSVTADTEIQEEGGRGLVDWFDSSFELDPKDTASARIKLFLASIREVEIGNEREPVRTKLSFRDKAVRDRLLGRDLIMGVKTMSIRTQEAVDKLNLKLGKQYVTEIDNVKFRVTVDRVLTADDLTDPTILANAEEEGMTPQVGDVLLRLEEWRPRPNILRSRENFLGFAQLVDFEDLFQEILEVTSGLPNTLESFTNALKEEGKSFRPVLIEVANQINTQTPEIQREFVKVMSKQYSEHSILLYTKRRNGMLDMTSINANAGSAVNSVLKQWQENQKQSAIISQDEVGNLVINRQLAQVFADRLDQIIDAYDSEELPNVETVLKPFARDLFEANGIVLPQEALDYLFGNMTRLTRNTSIAGGLKEQFSFTQDGLPTGMFSALVSALNGQEEEATEEEQRDYLINNNPLYTVGTSGEGTTIRLLARLAYRFSPKTAAGTHQNSEGKSIYAYTMNTHLSTSINKLKTDSDYRAKLATTHLGRNSWLLERLNTDTKARDSFGLQYVDGLKEAYKRNARGITRPSMSTREQLLFALGHFHRQGNKNANFVSLTHSDKSTTPLFTGITKVYAGKTGIAQSVQDMIYRTILGEFERIRDWFGNHNTANDSYNKGGGFFYFLPELNYDYMRNLVREGQITEAELQSVWLGKGQPNMSTGVIDFKRIVLKIFDQQWLSPERDKLSELMRAEGFYSNQLVDFSYMTKNLHNVDMRYNAVDQVFLDAVTGEEIDSDEAMERFYDWANKDFLVNYWLVNTAVSSLVFGDPALAYKGKSTTDYRAVEETLNEYQKRLAKDIAPGQDLTWENGPTETYKALTILDDERVHAYLNELEKYAGEKINGTDAQELTTVREHLYVMRSAGTISEQHYQEMLTIIREGLDTPSKYYEFKNPEHVKIVMQIMKPVHVSQNFDEVPGTATIHYIKSSSMPLYPPMTKYYEIDDLRIAMEGTDDATHIPRANFISAKKMGAPNGRGVKIFDNNGNVNIPVNLNSFIQVLTRSGFRIQQEVPYDELKEAILTGSQSNKLFVEGIEDKTFTVDGKEYTGTELKALKEQVRINMVKLQHQAFIDKTGAVIVADKLIIHDKTKLLSLLEDEAVSRSYPPNDIAMLKRTVQATDPDGQTRTELAIPLFFNPSSSRFESLMMSLVKKIGQIYMPGKSYIQAASSGFKFKAALNFEQLDSGQKQGIVWLPEYDGSELKTMTKDSPAQILLPFNFTVKGKDGQDETVNVQDFAIKDEQGKWIIDMTRVPKELTEHIAFRIPTQKHNSMLPMQVVGFIPANMGDTIVVPAAITRQMGSDFDVDKLFTYRRPYKYNKQTKSFYVDNSQGTVDGLARQYFDIYWSVLTHPDMYETVLQPLDKPDLKNEGIRASQNAPVQNFFSVTHQLLDYVSQKDAKIMVGISSLFVTFNSLVEGKQLVVGSYVNEDKEPSWEQEGEQGPEAYVAQAAFKPDGIKFVPEGEVDSQEAYHISKKGTARYYEEDVETRVDENGNIRKVFVDPLSGAESDFVNARTQYRSRIDSQVTFQSAFLDHAKERIIDKLNINLQTVYAAFGATAIVSEQGERMSEKHISLLLRQPAILDLVSRLSRSQDSLSDSFDANIFQTLLDQAIDSHLADAAAGGDSGAMQILSRPTGFREVGSINSFLSSRNVDTVEISTLKSNLEEKDTVEYHLQQAGALKVFGRLTEIGRAMGDIQRVLNQDPRGPGKDMTIVLDTIQKRSNLVANTVINGAEQLLNSEQGFIHRTELDTARDSYREVLPYEGFTRNLEIIKELTGKIGLSTDAVKDIVSDFKSYTFSDSNLGLSIDPDIDRYRLLYGIPENNVRNIPAQDNLATRVWKAQQTSNNYFLKRLRPQQGTTPNTPSYVFYLASRASALDDQENTAAFLELLTSSDENLKRLGEDLVRYAYVTGGISGGFSFIKYIPVDYLIALPFASRLRTINNMLAYEEAKAEPDWNFIHQWVRHNPSMLRKVPKGFNEKVGEKIVLPTPADAIRNADVRPLLGAKGDYPEYLSHWDAEEVQWKLFRKLDGSANAYKRIDTLGNSYSTEFSSGKHYKRSIFSENRALITPTFEGVKTEPVVLDREIVATGTEPWSTDAVAQLKITKQVYTTHELTALLKSMSTNKKLNGANRYMLGEFSEMINRSQRNNPLTLEMSVPKEGTTYVGSFNPSTGVILMNDTNHPINDVAGTIVHELGHALVTSFTRMPTSQQRSHEAAYEALQKVYDSLAEARQTVIAEAAKEGIDEERLAVLADMMHTGTAYVENEVDRHWAELAYATSNVDEYLSHLWENRTLQEFLARQKSVDGKRSLMSSILDKIAAFLKELKKVLGFTVPKDSQLAVSLKRSFEFLQEITIIGESLRRPDNVLKLIANTYYNGVAPSNLTWYHNTEESALDVYDAMRDEFPWIKVMLGVEDDGRFSISVENATIYKSKPDVSSVPLSTLNPLDRVHGKIQEQIRDISSSIARNKSNPDILRQRQLLRELKVLNNDVKATQDLNSIKDLAEFQLAWAEKVKTQFLGDLRPTSINQIMTAYRLIGVWTDLLDLIYNETDESSSIEYDEDFAKIQGRAKTLQNIFNKRIMKKVFKEISQDKITEADFTNMEDTHSGGARFLSIDRAKDKVTQEIGLTIQNTHRAYLEKGQQVVKELRLFEDEMKQLASKRGQHITDFYEQFFQSGPEWGLVTKYTPDFYKWKSNLRHKLTDQINLIEQSQSDTTARNAMIRAAIDKYWRSLDHKAGFVDVRLFLDEDGNALTTNGAGAYKKALVDEYGQEFVDDILSEATEKYKQYLQDREDIEIMYDTQVENDMMDEDEADEAKAQWDIENSPLGKLSSRLKGSGTHSNFSDKYLVLVPHKTATGFDGKSSLFDSKFDNIKNDKDLLSTYKKIEKLIQEYTGNLPFYLEGKFNDSFLPAIKQRLVTDVTDAIKYVKNIPTAMVDQLTATSYEEFMQSRTSREIPILYMDNPFEGIEKPPKEATKEQWAEYEAKKKERAKGYSRNLPRVLELFGLMSYHYKYFSDARDAIDLGEEILRKTDRDMQANLRQVEKNGKLVTVQASLKNTLGALEYTRDVLMYKRARALEGKTGEIVRKKDKTITGKLRDIKAEQINLEKMLENNEISPEKYLEEQKLIDEKLKGFDIKKVYASKVGDTLINWTQLKSLSYNPMSAINNLVFGLISTTVHANGGQDYNWTDFRKAFSIMMNSTGRSLGLFRITGNDSAASKTANKVLNLMDRMGIMGELVDSEYGESNIVAKKKGLRSVLAPYQMLRTGDYFVKALNMVAILHHNTVEVNGEKKSLWALLDEEGNFTGQDESWQSEDPLKQTKWNKIRNKVIAVNKITMGNQDKSSPILAKKNILWRLVGQFRLSWFSEGIANRFEGKSTDIQLGRERKGRYRTYGDLGFTQSVGVLSKQLLSVLPFTKLDPYANTKLKSGEDMSDTDKANMRRNMAEICWFLLMFGAAQMIGALASGDDDDDTKKSIYRFAANMAIRSYQDVGLYSNPTIFDQILGTPAPALATVKDVVRFFQATGKLAMDDEYTSEQWFYKLTKAGFIPQTTLINRFKTMTEKDLSDLAR